MKRKIRTFAVLSIISALSLAFTACGTNKAEPQNTAGFENNIQEKSDKSDMPDRQFGTMAKVTAVNGTNITVTEANMPEDKADKPNSAPPSDNDNKDDKKQPPTDDNKSEKPDNPPNDKRPEMNFDGEEKTISVSDNIYIDSGNGEQTKAEIGDITVGSIISIKYADDKETVEQICIMPNQEELSDTDNTTTAAQ